MKVLIMEDEVQIREGLRSEISWDRYGITEVYTAQNGEMGFRMAKELHPEIIISDIRMPKLDGISAIKRLKDILPDSSVIFISAYAEKNYFKEAIRLKAVSFIEKPIDMNELHRVLQEAAREQWQHTYNRKQFEMADSYYCQQLVKRLCRRQFADKDECRLCLEKAGVKGDKYAFFTSLIVYYRRIEGTEDLRWNQFCTTLLEAREDAPAAVLMGQNQSHQFVCHVFLKRKEELDRMVQWLLERIGDIPKCSLLVGSMQDSYMKLRESYNDAVLLTNRAFYCRYGEAVYGKTEDVVLTADWANWKKEFSEELAAGDLAAVRRYLKRLEDSILQNRDMHYAKVQELYLHLYGELNRYIEQKSIILPEENEESLQEILLDNGSFFELHGAIEKLVKRIEEASSHTEDVIVVHIKKYIQANYQNPWLSIKEIADSVGKSVSYTCVLFKKETGITLNQYLTETRLEASKVFLANPKNSIKVVAEKCGYADSGYYARAFRKYAGETPSEYRNEGGES